MTKRERLERLLDDGGDVVPVKKDDFKRLIDVAKASWEWAGALRTARVVDWDQQSDANHKRYLAERALLRASDALGDE